MRTVGELFLFIFGVRLGPRMSDFNFCGANVFVVAKHVLVAASPGFFSKNSEKAHALAKVIRKEFRRREAHGFPMDSSDEES